VDWVNVTLPEGFDGSRTWAITSDDAALNLTTADVTAVIKPTEHYEDDDDLAYPLSEGDGVTIVNAAVGTVKLDIPGAVTAAPSAWFYKINVTLAGETDTAIAGWIYIADT
jgi:hypothetical protein